MNPSKRYSSELRNRAVQMALEHGEWNPHRGPSADGDVELVPQGPTIEVWSSVPKKAPGR